jgi:hypothetical protein
MRGRPLRSACTRCRGALGRSGPGEGQYSSGRTRWLYTPSVRDTSRMRGAACCRRWIWQTPAWRDGCVHVSIQSQSAGVYGAPIVVAVVVLMLILLGRLLRPRRRRLERGIQRSAQRGRLREMRGLLVVVWVAGAVLGRGRVRLARRQRRGEESGVNWVGHYLCCLVVSAGRCSRGRRVCAQRWRFDGRRSERKGASGQHKQVLGITSLLRFHCSPTRVEASCLKVRTHENLKGLMADVSSYASYYSRDV